MALPLNKYSGENPGFGCSSVSIVLHMEVPQDVLCVATALSPAEPSELVRQRAVLHCLPGLPGLSNCLCWPGDIRASVTCCLFSILLPVAFIPAVSSTWKGVPSSFAVSCSSSPGFCSDKHPNLTSVLLSGEAAAVGFEGWFPDSYCTFIHSLMHG